MKITEKQLLEMYSLLLVIHNEYVHLFRENLKIELKRLLADILSQQSDEIIIEPSEKA